jgi:hypothetical protein
MDKDNVSGLVVATLADSRLSLKGFDWRTLR